MANNFINIATLEIDTKLVEKKSVDLKKSIVDLEVKMKDLKKSTNNLSTANDEELKTFTDLERQLKSTRGEYNSNSKNLTAFLDIQKNKITTDGNELKSLKQLKQERSLLQKQVQEIHGKTTESIAKREELNKTIDAHTAAINDNSSSESKRTQGIGEYEKAITKALNKKALEETKKHTKEMQSYNTATTEVLGNVNVLGVNIGGLITRLKNGSASLKTMIAGLKVYKTSVKTSAISTGVFSRSLGVLKLALLSTGIGALALLLGTLAIGYGVLVKNSRAFSVAQSGLKAVLGGSKKEMEALSKEALRLGQITEFTATEVSNLQSEFAKLGFPTDDIIALSESTLNAASAMGSGLAETAKLTGSVLKTFKLDASEASKVNDILSDSTTKSALDFDKLSNSMSTVGPVAKAYGFDVSDTVTLLGTLSDAGFDASSAATATRNIMLNLADANGKLAKSLKKPVTDLPSLVEGLQQLSDEGIDLAKGLELSDKRSVAAFATFLSGTKDIDKLSTALKSATGRAKEIAEIRLDNLTGDTTKLASAWEGFLLNIENGTGIFSRFSRNVVQGLTKIIGLANQSSVSEGSIRLDENIKAQKIEIDLLDELLDKSGKIGIERSKEKAIQAKKALDERLKDVKVFNDEYTTLIKERENREANLKKGVNTRKNGNVKFKRLSKADIDNQIKDVIGGLGSYEGSVKALQGVIKVAETDNKAYADSLKKQEEARRKQSLEKRKEGIEKANKVTENAIHQSDIRLQIFIAENKSKTKILEDSLSHAEGIYNKELDAIKAKNTSGEASDEAYNLAKLNLYNDSLSQSKGVYEKEIDLINEKNTAGKLSNEEATLAKLNLHNDYLEEQSNITASYAEKEIQDEVKKQQYIKDEKSRIKELELFEFENNLELRISQGESEFEIQKEILDREYAEKIANAQKIGADTEVIAKTHANNIEKIEQIRDRARLKETSKMFGGISKLFAAHTVASKAAAIAQATINTYQGVTEVWRAPTTLPEPFGTIAKGISTGVVLASGLSAVDEITATQTPKLYTGGRVEKLESGVIKTPQNVSTQEGGDNVLAYVKQGEVILNENQQRNAMAMFGTNVFNQIGVPGFNSGGIAGKRSTTTVNRINVQNDNDGLSEVITQAVRDGLNATKLVLPVDQVTEIQNRISTIENEADV